MDDIETETKTKDRGDRSLRSFTQYSTMQYKFYEPT
jgi:hypothetical protein